VTPAAFLTAFAEAVANDGALILLVLLILWLGARRKWVWSRELDRIESQLTDERVKCLQEIHDMREERDQWRRIALYQSGHPQPDGQPPPPSSTRPPEGD
jgi:hypothetical protein